MGRYCYQICYGHNAHRPQTRWGGIQRAITACLVRICVLLDTSLLIHSQPVLPLLYQ